jgi:hypothetical protein
MKPYQINATRVIVIPDFHQDINFAREALEKEKSNYDHIITLGDEFDSHKSFPAVAGIKETAQFAIDLQRGTFGSITQLLGNHSLAYAESWYSNSRFSHKRHLMNCCGGFTNSKSIEINKIFKWENWQKYQLFCEFGGFLISHAGFHPSFWNFYKTREENLDALWEESVDALRSISIKSSRLFGCGQARGGQLKAGGPCWLDFNDEFDDNPELPPQIVGHTQSCNEVKQKGRSYCIDGAQQIYIVMDENGGVEVKTLHPSGNWSLNDLNFPRETRTL